MYITYLDITLLSPNTSRVSPNDSDIQHVMETHKEEPSSDDDYDKVESMAGSGISEHVQFSKILKYFHQNPSD